MPSSTDTGPHAWLEAARDTRHLMAFRARTVRRRGAAFLGLAVVVVLTAVFAVVPSRVDLRSGGSAPFERALAALESNLGAAFAGFLLLAVGAAMGSGGGRELLSRSEAAVHPISPVTEHLGALLLAPVNLAWMVQAWGLLAVTALVTPPGHLVGAQLVVLAWVLAATALGQAAGWAVEGVRRTARGVLVVRIGAGAVVVVLAALHLAGLLAPLARSLPTTWLADTSQTGRWPLALGALLLLDGDRARARRATRPPGRSGCRRARSCGCSRACTRHAPCPSRAGAPPTAPSCAASTAGRCGARSACAAD